MAIFTSRAVPKTIIGRGRALTVSGNSRFARIANLTGKEASLKAENVASRLARKVINWLNFRGPQLEHAFAGAEGTTFLGGIERIDATATISRMADNSAGTKVGGNKIGGGDVARGTVALRDEKRTLRRLEKGLKITGAAGGLGVAMVAVGGSLVIGGVSPLNIAVSILVEGGCILGGCSALVFLPLMFRFIDLPRRNK